VQAGEVMLVSAPLALLYSEEGTTPENEELAEFLAAEVAATPAPAAAAAAGGSSKGLAPWQQHALLQMRGAGAGGAASKPQQQQQQQGLPDLRQLLGPPDEPVQMHDSSSSSSEAGGGQQQQQQQVQQLPSAEEVLQLVFANCTGRLLHPDSIPVVSASAAAPPHCLADVLELSPPSLPSQHTLRDHVYHPLSNRRVSTNICRQRQAPLIKGV
jgi:hypothetical protein